MYISWVWSMTDIVFCHFAYIFPFYPTNNPKNQNFERTKKMPIDIVILHLCTKNHMVYGSRDMECDRHIFIIVDHFLPGYSSTNPENQNFEKMKRRNAQKYHHFTQVYHNDNHMMYGSWDMKQDRQNLSSFWATFCPLTPLKTTKFLKKWKKKSLEIPSFYTSASKIMIICYTVPEI